MPHPEPLELRSLMASIVDLGPLTTGGLGELLANVTGINSTAEVVGQWVGNQPGTLAADYQAFLLDNNGVTHPVGPLPGSPNSFANAINDSGQVVGYSSQDSGLGGGIAGGGGGRRSRLLPTLLSCTPREP